MNIRDAVAADVPRLVELLQQLSLDDEVREGDPRDPRYVRALEAIVREGGRVLVVDDGGVIAMGELRITSNLSHQGRKVAHVESVVVDAKKRGQKIGERLMARIIDDAKSAGCFRVELSSNSGRKDAHRFYVRLGFTPSHTGFKLSLS